jgi:hypothetical protein
MKSAGRRSDIESILLSAESSLRDEKAIAPGEKRSGVIGGSTSWAVASL